MEIACTTINDRLRAFVPDPEHLSVFFKIAGVVGCDISDPAEQHSSVHGTSEEPVPWCALEDWRVCSLSCSSGSVAFNSSPELKTSSDGSSGRGSNMKQACNEMNNVYNQS